MKCLYCQEEILNPKFCGSSCAAKHNNKGRIRTKESKLKTSLTLKKLKIKPPKSKRGRRWAKEPDNNWISYKEAARFYTPYYLWPKLKGYELLEQFGWYHPTKNPNGVSRDHMYSVKDGWDNKVPFNIINHPANCCLMINKDNNIKGRKSSITLEELNCRVENWRP